LIKFTTDDIEGKAPEITQSLDKLAREGARRMILAVLELEVDQYVQGLRHLHQGFSKVSQPYHFATSNTLR